MTQRRAYPSDLPDARWALIEPTLAAWRQARTEAGVGGRPPKHDLRELFNAILYVNRTGIPWRYLPHDFPPHETVYSHFAAWKREGIFTQLNVDLTGLARTTSGRQAEPTACIIDTQSVKTSTNVPLTDQGIDAGKRIVGRKRGVVTDTLGLLLAVIVTAASVSDNAIGIRLFDQAKAAHPQLAAAWADTDFRVKVVEHAAQLGINVQVVARNSDVKGFSVLPRRRVVERSIGWLMVHRRLARDYEVLPASSEAHIRIAMIDNLLKRVTGETTQTWRGTY
jgi:transposase